MIIGCDFHPSWQQVCWLDTETGEIGERKLVHAQRRCRSGFIEQLPAAGADRDGSDGQQPVVRGFTGQRIWATTMWIGDAAQIRASYVRQAEDGSGGTRSTF